MDKTAKNVEIDFLEYHDAFVCNIQSEKTKVTKRCVCVPIEDNFMDEQSYTQKNTGKLIHKCVSRMKMWPTHEEAKEKYQLPNDWSLKLDVPANVMKRLQKENPDYAASLSYGNSKYDTQLVKETLPYVGVAYELVQQPQDNEGVPTMAIAPEEGAEDLPF